MNSCELKGHLNMDTVNTGVSTYKELPDKPSINGVTLEGNVTSDNLGLGTLDTSGFVKKDTKDLEYYTTTEDLERDYAKKNDIPSLPSADGLASTTYVDNAIKGLVDNDIKTLTELITENQDNMISKFESSKPSNGLITINAVTSKSGNKEVITIYNDIDGKYPYSALAAQQGKALNDKITTLEERIQRLESASVMEISDDKNSKSW